MHSKNYDCPNEFLFLKIILRKQKSKSFFINIYLIKNDNNQKVHLQIKNKKRRLKFNLISNKEIKL
jgi:hypothetical protein